MCLKTKDYQHKISYQEALQNLKEGNQRFIKNQPAKRNLLKQLKQTSNAQYPFAAILSCIDSRTSAELIFDQGLGDIFSIRVAGNVINSDILASMEYACNVVKSKIIVVMGHTQCGAVMSACNNFEMGHITALLSKIKPCIAKEGTNIKNRHGGNPEFVNLVSEINVMHTVEQIREQSKILYKLEQEGDIRIVGAFYDLNSGLVRFFDKP